MSEIFKRNHISKKKSCQYRERSVEMMLNAEVLYNSTTAYDLRESEAAALRAEADEVSTRRLPI